MIYNAVLADSMISGAHQVGFRVYNVGLVGSVMYNAHIVRLIIYHTVLFPSFFAFLT